MLKKILFYYRRYFWSGEKHALYLGVTIGKNCRIVSHNFGSEPYLVKIGDHVQITDNVCFFTHGGGWVFRDKYPLLDTFGKIEVGNNVYIGHSSMILPGVTIGNNVIIGAGSVVTKSIGDNLIVAGNPVQIIGTLPELEKRILLFDLNIKKMSYNEKKKYLLSLDDSKFLKKRYIQK